mmetsp:Transcript_8961/g.16142  ORF Transcript_8961/g.16142 Transcript_8961/m.16142 type:complete len:243 (-) Transcript_8961:69-797(-)
MTAILPILQPGTKQHELLLSHLGHDFEFFPSDEPEHVSYDSCSDEEEWEAINKRVKSKLPEPAAEVIEDGGDDVLRNLPFLPKQSALHDLVGIDRAEKIEKALLKGADVNSKDSLGETPLFWAESEEVVGLLDAYGADLRCENIFGSTAFYKMAGQGKTTPMRALSRHLAKKGLLKDQLNAPASCTKRTALHCAAHNGYEETVKELLALPGINRGPQDYLGKTPADLAKSRGFDSIVALLDS